MLLGVTIKHHFTEHKRALRSDEAAQSAVAEHAMENDKVGGCRSGGPQSLALPERPEAWHIRTEWHKIN